MFIILKRLISVVHNSALFIGIMPFVIVLFFVPRTSRTYGIFSVCKRASYLDIALYRHKCFSLLVRAHVCSMHLASNLGVFCVCVIMRGVPPNFKLDVGRFYHVTDFFPTPDHFFSLPMGSLVTIQFFELVGERSSKFS